jgi:tRNA(fMet)-specific endonuclease VapC
LFQDGHATICKRARKHPQNELAITVLSVEEQLSGWYTALRRAKRIDRLAWAYRRLAENVRFLSRIHIVAFDEAAVLRYQELTKLKLKVRKTDLRIAATVLENGATLVTRNSRDFKHVTGLVFTHWSV